MYMWDTSIKRSTCDIAILVLCLIKVHSYWAHGSSELLSIDHKVPEKAECEECEQTIVCGPCIRLCTCWVPKSQPQSVFSHKNNFLAMSHMLEFIERLWDGLDHVRPLGYWYSSCGGYVRLSWGHVTNLQSGNEAVQESPLRPCTPCVKVLKIVGMVALTCTHSFTHCLQGLYTVCTQSKRVLPKLSELD